MGAQHANPKNVVIESNMGKIKNNVNVMALVDLMNLKLSGVGTHLESF